MTYDPQTFAWWKAQLAGEKGPYQDVDVHQGFYAYKGQNKKLEPVALWYNKSGELLASLGSEERDGKLQPRPYRNGAELWVSVMRNPIPHGVFLDVVAGNPWPNEIRLTLSDGTVDSTMGHNSQSSIGTLGNIEEWCDQMDRALKKGVPETQEEADAISDLATKLIDLSNEADKERLGLTKPFREAEEKVNTEWMPLIKKGKDRGAKGKASVGIWLVKEKERRNAEAKRLQDEINAKRLAENPVTLDEVTAPPIVVEAAPVRAGTRKSVSMVTKSFVVVSDLKAFMNFFAEMEDGPPESIMIELKKVAFPLLKNGIKIPGAKIENSEGAR